MHMHRGPGDCYKLRASECLAFARKARDPEEKTRLLIMARTLRRLAFEWERKKALRQRGLKQTSHWSVPLKCDISRVL